MHKRIRTVSMGLLFGLAVSTTASAAGSKDKQWKDAPSKTIAQDVEVQPAKEKQFSIPPLQSGKRMLLKITARRNSPKMGGYGWYVQYELNGNPLDAARDRRSLRLVNKSAYFTRPSGEKVFWNRGDGVWHTFFAPDFQTDVSRYHPKKGGDPYTMVLDVTDMVRHEKSSKLTVRSLVPAARAKTLDFMPSIHARIAILTPEGDKSLSSPQPAKLTLSGKPEVRLTSDGGFSLAFEDAAVPFESVYSHPGGGVNHLGGEPSPSAEKQWRVSGHKVGADQWQINASGKYYTVRRLIEKHEDHVKVRDTFTNFTGQPVGIRLSNQLNFEKLPIYFCRMGGKRGQSLNNIYSPENPTLYYPLTDSGLGMVADDDVYRNQALLFYNLHKRVTGLRDNIFSLDAGKTYTMTWTIYYTPKSDYYGFINRVRRDWGANITIPAPVYFSNYHTFARMSDEGIRNLMNKHDVKYLAFWEMRTPKPVEAWGNKKVVAEGPGIHSPIFKHERKLLNKAVENVHRVAPDVQVTLYTHSFFMSPQKPDDKQYKDSWITGPDGDRKISHYNQKDRLDYRLVYPTLTNQYGKAYMKLIGYYLNDVGLDWIYWDESNGPGVTREKSGQIERRATHNAWDGHSARIDPKTGKIKEKFAILPLITRPFFEAAIDRIEANGGHLLFNGSALTKRRRTTASFVETQWKLTSCYRPQLNTPLAFGLGDPSMAVLRQRLNFGLLYARTHLGYKSSVVEHFYPFTPMELHSGWVKGRERIITAESGRYGWNSGPSGGELLRFGAEGKLLNRKKVNAAEGEKMSVDVPKGGIAILVRDKN